METDNHINSLIKLLMKLIIAAMSFVFLASCSQSRISSEIKIHNEDDLIKLSKDYAAGKFTDRDGNPIYKVVRLEKDIVMTRTFSPIGTSENPFFGYFDGQNHTIKNLTIDGDTMSMVAMFGFVKDAHIQDLKLENLNVSGMNNVSGVCAYGYGTMFMRCSVKGNISGKSYIGGVAGELDYSTLDGCSFDGCINGTKYSVGGIVGLFEYGVVMRCKSSGSFQGDRDVDGIVGSTYECMLIESESTAQTKSLLSANSDFDKISRLLFASF